MFEFIPEKKKKKIGDTTCFCRIQTSCYFVKLRNKTNFELQTKLDLILYKETRFALNYFCTLQEIVDRSIFVIFRSYNSSNFRNYMNHLEEI